MGKLKELYTSLIDADMPVESLEESQSRLEQWAGQFNDNELLSGSFIQDVTIGTSSTRIAHKLGHRPQGWIIADRDTDCRIWRADTHDDKYSYLISSASVEVSIYFF